MSRVTLNDVASKAGISRSTVSRVINGGSVSERKKKAVLQAIHELNYEPDESARAFKTNKSRTIALMVPSVFHPFYMELTFYLECLLYEHDYKMILCNSNGDPAKELKYISMVKNNMIDGVIGIVFDDIEEFLYSGIPFVSIDRLFEQTVPMVSSDHFAGGQIAFKELYRRGCRNIAYINERSLFGYTPELRRSGFLEQAQQHNLSVTLLELPANLDKQGKENQILTFFRDNQPIDGIFAHNDITALQILELQKKIGVTIPDELQLIGFDGIKVTADVGSNISSIRQNVPEIANRAVQVLFQLFQNEQPEKQNVIPVAFVQGNTTSQPDKS